MSDRDIYQTQSVLADCNHIMLLSNDDPYRTSKPTDSLAKPNVGTFQQQKVLTEVQTPTTKEQYLKHQLLFFVPRMIWSYNVMKRIIVDGDSIIERLRLQIKRREQVLNMDTEPASNGKPIGSLEPTTGVSLSESSIPQYSSTGTALPAGRH